MILKFDVRGEKLACDKDLIITEGNKGTYEAEFVFDSMWDSYAKVCIFENEGECVPVAVINSKAILPLADRISAKIGVIGVEVHEDGSISTRISTNMLSVSVRNGAASSSAVSKLSKEAELWEVYIAKLDEKAKEITQISETAIAQITKIASESINAIESTAKNEIENVNTSISNTIKEGQEFAENLDAEVEAATKVVTNLVNEASQSAAEAEGYKNESMDNANAAGIFAAEAEGYKNEAHTSAMDAESYKDEAQVAEDGASQALSDLLNMINSGDIVLAVDGKLPLSSIPATATQEIYVVESESALTSLVAQRGDLAELVETVNGERTITKTWQCLGNPSSRDNWVVWGTSYAVSAGNAEQSKSAENSARINGHRLVEMSEEDFENAVKDDDTYYLVY